INFLRNLISASRELETIGGCGGAVANQVQHLADMPSFRERRFRHRMRGALFSRSSPARNRLFSHLDSAKNTTPIAIGSAVTISQARYDVRIWPDCGPENRARTSMAPRSRALDAITDFQYGKGNSRE